MREEIRKIMEMNRAGKISDDQMVELIEALKEGGDEKPSGNARKRPINDDIEDAMESIMGGVGGLLRGIGQRVKGFNAVSDADGNAATMSKLATGFSERVRENSFSLSKVGDIGADESSSFTRNSVNASSLRDVSLRENASVTESSFNASSVTGLELSASAWEEVSVNASKLKDLSFRRSKFEDCRFNGTKMSGCVFEDCRFEDVEFNTSNLSGLTLKGVELKGREIAIRHLSGRTFESTEEFLAAISDG